MNSWVRVSAPAPVLELPPGALRLQCDGVEIAGTLHVDGERLAFEPDTDLPSSLTCTATVDPGVMLANGETLTSSSFTFTTQSDPSTDFAFEAPQTLSTDGGYANGVVTDGQDVIVYWTVGDLVYAVSRDGGDTFSEPKRLETPSDSPLVSDVHVALRDGVAHFFWRVLPVNSPGFAYYARLDDELAALHGPTLLMPEPDNVNVVTVGMGSDGEQQLRVAWSGRVICDQGPCPLGNGVWSASSSNAGETWTSHGRVEPLEGDSPEVVWTSGGFLTAWLTDEAVSVFDYDFSSRATLSVASQEQKWPFAFHSAGQGDALLAWAEGPGIGIQTTYLARYINGSFEPPSTVLTETEESPNGYVRLATTRTPRVAMLRCLGKLFGETVRSVSLSRDGRELYAPQVLDFLHANGDDAGGDDTFCPGIALDDDSRLHMLWDRDPTNLDPHAILYARGERATPCAL